MRTGPSLLTRLLAWQTGTLVVTLLLFTLILNVVLAQRLRGHHDEGLTRVCLRAAELVRRTPFSGHNVTPALRERLRRLEFPVQVLPFEESHEDAEPGISLDTRTDAVGDDRRVARTLVEREGEPPVWVVVSESLGDLDSTLAGMRLVSFTIGPLILLAAVAVIVVNLRYSLRPLKKVVQLAGAIEANSLNTRLNLRNAPAEIRHLADTFNQMVERLESSFAEVHRFTANASHELRTPLTLLTSALEVALAKNRTPDEYRALLHQCLGEVQRLTRIVENLLVMAQTDAGKVELALQPLDLDLLISEAIESAQPLAEKAGIELSMDVQPVQVEGDANWLRQLFGNLIDNAVKYTPAGGRVILRGRASKGRVQIDVEDTGIGIDPGELPHVFERFHRCVDAKGQSVEGVGLGLSIAQWVVGCHAGTITVKSRKGHGSCFTVTLPAPFESASVMEPVA